MYEIKFDADALKAWNELQKQPRQRFQKMLQKRRENPRIASALVKGSVQDIYRLKFSSKGLRLIYQVREPEKVIFVIGIGKRDNGEVYDDMQFIRLI